jgi:hypothetical protein
VSFREAGHRSSALLFMEMLNMKYRTVKARRVNIGEVLQLLEVSGQVQSMFATLVWKKNHWHPLIKRLGVLESRSGSG